MRQAIAIGFAVIASISVHAQLSFDGAAYETVAVSPAASTGLEKVYVVNNALGMSISYSTGTAVKWSRFSANGAAYAEELGTATSIELSADDCGYIAETEGRAHYYWVVNYANHHLAINSVTPSAEQADCMRTQLDIDGSGDRITYYTINGRPEELSREIELSYNTLVYDADAAVYQQQETKAEIGYIRPVVAVDAPLCDTRFTVSGDRFLKAWNMPVSVESPMYATSAVAAETSAQQERREVDNEQRVDAAELGGSAPCDIEFTAVTTDAAIFHEWQFALNPEFDPIDDRYTENVVNYTFRNQGTTYVRFFAADESGRCEFTGPVYQVVIGESSLLCPNAFTPESSPGVNDEWKVSYKSIVSFECHIFNRWGTEMFSFTDPSVGWDGKYKGKYVPAGTYFYVIKARGADGRDYKLSGDINIIKSKSINQTDTTE